MPTADDRAKSREQAIRRAQDSVHDWGDLTPPVVEVHTHIEKRDSSQALPHGVLGKVVKVLIGLAAALGALWQALH